MPGYGIVGAEEGSGLLPWGWACERLAGSRNYWVSTVWPDGRPHTMPVWGVWLDEGLWFSSFRGSRKARNLAAEPRCTVATQNPGQPVVVSGRGTPVLEPGALQRFLHATNEKYGTSYGPELVEHAANTTFRVEPDWVFGLDEADFTGSPTRWDF